MSVEACRRKYATAILLPLYTCARTTSTRVTLDVVQPTARRQPWCRCRESEQRSVPKYSLWHTGHTKACGLAGLVPASSCSLVVQDEAQGHKMRGLRSSRQRTWPTSAFILLPYGDYAAKRYSRLDHVVHDCLTPMSSRSKPEASVRKCRMAFAPNYQCFCIDRRKVRWIAKCEHVTGHNHCHCVLYPACDL